MLTATVQCEWGGANCPPARADGFCSDAHRRAWYDDDRRYEMYLDTRDDYLADRDEED